MPNQWASNMRQRGLHSHHITRHHANQPGREKPAMPLTSTPLHQTALRGQPRRIRGTIRKVRVRPPVYRLPRISSNQRLHRRRNTLHHHTLRTTPKRGKERTSNPHNMLEVRDHLIHRLQPTVIQHSATTSLLRIRVKKHHIKKPVLPSHRVHKPRHHVIHRLRIRRHQSQRQKHTSFSRAPVTQCCPTGRTSLNSVLKRGQTETLDLLIQKETILVPVVMQLDTLRQRSPGAHNRHHRRDLYPTLRGHKPRSHSLNHKRPSLRSAATL